MYEHGRGVPQDYAEALKWYRKAADQGNADAQDSVGSMYEQGKGVPQNYAEALKWYRKAAEQGDSSAQTSLGGMYEWGLGVPQNYIWAHRWFNLAAYNLQNTLLAEIGREIGISRRDRVAGKMTAAQIVQAQTMADQCLRSNYRDCGSPQVARREDEVTSPPTGRNKVTSTGTAFFISQNGHIVTNAHVVYGCQTVRSSRGGLLRKVSIDEASDLALYVASEKPNSIAHLRGGRGARAGGQLLRSAFP